MAVAGPDVQGLAVARELNSKPLVSVVLPVYNGERWLASSLQSVLAQTYSRFEVLVMDDASTDATGAIARSFADDRVRYHRNEQNLGQFGNVNAGIARASGELVALYHADDLFEPDLIEREVEYLVQNPQAGGVFCTDVFIDPEGREFGRSMLPAEFQGGRPLEYGDVLNGVLRYGNVFLRGQTSMIRRSVYEDVGPFVEHYGLRGDLEMWLRVARRAPLGIVDQHLVRYRWGHENVSRLYERLRTEPELWFALVDDLLAAGDRRLAAPDALTAYEAHRAEDLLRVAINQYVLGGLSDARRTLRSTRVASIVRSRRVQRTRLVGLWAALNVLCRLPPIGPVADAFYRRWGRGR